MTLELKTCIRCNKTKPLADFHKDKSKKDGHRPYCMECRNKRISKNIKGENESLFREGKRRCRDCNKIKPIQEFNANKTSKDGYRNQCKSCQAEYKNRHYKANKNEIRRYQSRYYKTSRGKQVRKRRQQKCLGTPEERLKIQARGAVNDAIRYGKLQPARIQYCIECGDQAKEYHHHRGYEKKHWLDVVPLCKGCHKD